MNISYYIQRLKDIQEEYGDVVVDLEENEILDIVYVNPIDKVQINKFHLKI